MTNLPEWIINKTNGEWWVYVKRLSANDTGLTGGNGVGIYIPQIVALNALPLIAVTTSKNPSCPLKAQVTSHGFPQQDIRAVYYNNKHFPASETSKRNEHRLTRWNTDVKNSPVQDPENTGALALLAFHVPIPGENSEFLDVWICKNPREEEFVEGLVGEIIPGSWLFDEGNSLFDGFTHIPEAAPSCISILPTWIEKFPRGDEIIAHLSEAMHFKKTTPDKLIIRRRDEEYKLFRLIEEHHTLNKVNKGFESVDEFMRVANSVSNRRKSRSGKSLEIHLEHIFKTFGALAFSTQCRTEGNKRPDFIFPSCSAYRDMTFPAEKLRVLAVKTTCKDRWRQILNEANRVDKMHLFTLQEGVSLRQFEEMSSENVTLVVPKPLHRKYPRQLRDKLMTLEGFIDEIKRCQ